MKGLSAMFNYSYECENPADYYQHYDQLRDEFIEKRMEESKADLLRKVAEISHPLMTMQIAKTLAFAYFEGSDDANQLYIDLKLDEQQFLAILGKKEEFSKILFQDVFVCK